MCEAISSVHYCWSVGWRVCSGRPITELMLAVRKSNHLSVSSLFQCLKVSCEPSTLNSRTHSQAWKIPTHLLRYCCCYVVKTFIATHQPPVVIHSEQQQPLILPPSHQYIIMDTSCVAAYLTLQRWIKQQQLRASVFERACVCIWGRSRLLLTFSLLNELLRLTVLQLLAPSDVSVSTRNHVCMHAW